MKSDFLANISHEIRTPLNAVIGLAGILSRTTRPDDPNQLYLQTMKESAESLLELVNNMLDYSKIESGMLYLDPLPFDLFELVDQIGRMMSMKAKEKGLEFHIQYADGMPHRFIGDAPRLRQVLQNLAGNAIKFTQAGAVSIAVGGVPSQELDSWQISIEVTDTGIGIPAEKIEAMFHKFTQEDGFIHRQYGGTGLGLAICRELSRLLGGHIQVSSVVDKGSSFTLTVPLAVGAVPAESESSANAYAAEPVTILPSAEASEAQPYILLVEDSNPNVMVTTTILEELGFPYEVAWDGFEALERLTRQCFGVVLMDVQMPNLNGLEATRVQRQREAEQGQARVPIIAITAYAFEDDRQRCLQAGMDDYLSKPFEVSEFKEKLLRLTAMTKKLGE